MPLYEYRCLTCDERFERRTAVGAADDVRCDHGHAEVKRLLSAFAVSRGGSVPAPSMAPAPSSGGGGGCCGGACGCG